VICCTCHVETFALLVHASCAPTRRGRCRASLVQAREEHPVYKDLDWRVPAGAHALTFSCSVCDQPFLVGERTVHVCVRALPRAVIRRGARKITRPA
jgi:hypothetical protein